MPTDEAHAHSPGPQLARPTDDHESEQILRAARADVAFLGLRLRAMLREEEERPARENDAKYSDVDPDDALARHQETLRNWVERRRRALRDEIENVRHEAADIVNQARLEAIDITFNAANEFRTLLQVAGVLAVDPVQVQVPMSPVAISSHHEEVTLPPAEVPLVAVTPTELADPPTSPGTRTHGGRPATVQDPGIEGVARKRPWTTFLYLDVLLPLIAVVLVVIVLLAWIG